MFIKPWKQHISHRWIKRDGRILNKNIHWYWYLFTHDIYCFGGSIFILSQQRWEKSHKMISKTLAKAMRYVLHSKTFILLIIEKNRLSCIKYLDLCVYFWNFSVEIETNEHILQKQDHVLSKPIFQKLSSYCPLQIYTCWQKHSSVVFPTSETFL